MTPKEAINGILTSLNALEVRGAENAKNLVDATELTKGLGRWIDEIEAKGREAKEQEKAEEPEAQNGADLS